MTHIARAEKWTTRCRECQNVIVPFQVTIHGKQIMRKLEKLTSINERDKHATWIHIRSCLKCSDANIHIFTSNVARYCDNR